MAAADFDDHKEGLEKTKLNNLGYRKKNHYQ